LKDSCLEMKSERRVWMDSRVIGVLIWGGLYVCIVCYIHKKTKDIYSFLFTFSSISVRNIVTTAIITKSMSFPTVERNIADIPNTIERK
jgi:hypothetical protein